MYPLLPILIVPGVVLVGIARRRAKRARLIKELFAATECGDIRVLKRFLSRHGTRNLADVALDDRGRTAHDLAVELRLHQAANLLGEPSISLKRRKTGEIDVRVWQSDRAISADRRSVAGRMRWPSVRLPAVSVLIEAGGETLYEHVDGFTNIRRGTRADANTKFLLGSVSKQFVAVAILRFQDDGLLDVRRDVLARWYPQFPRADVVTLHHLLTHTSGIRDYMFEMGFATSDARFTETQLIEHMACAGYMFHPGDRYKYSNTNYVLLGLVVQKVSGKSLSEYLRSTFFEPLGMSSTGMHPGAAEKSQNDHTVDGLVGYMKAVVPCARAFLRGTSYAPVPYKVALSFGPGCGGDGGIYSTAKDLGRWNKALYEDMLVISESSLLQALTRVKFNDGNIHGYGYGLVLNRVEDNFGVISYQHGGYVPGYTAHLMYIPERKMSIAVLSNASNGMRSAESLSKAMKTIWTHDLGSREREIPAPDATLSEEDLKRFVGAYNFTASGLAEVLKVRWDSESGVLSVNWGSSPLVAISPKSAVATAYCPVIKLTFLDDSWNMVLLERQGIARKAYKGRRQQPEDEVATYKTREATKNTEKILPLCCGVYDYGRPRCIIRRHRRHRNRLYANVSGVGGVSLIHMGGGRFCIDIGEPLGIVEFALGNESSNDNMTKPTHLVLQPRAEFPLLIKRVA